MVFIVTSICLVIVAGILYFGPDGMLTSKWFIFASLIIGGLVAIGAAHCEQKDE